MIGCSTTRRTCSIQGFVSFPPLQRTFEGLDWIQFISEIFIPG